MAKTVLFVHGMFMNALCWEKWLPYFQAKGYTVVAPSWKYHDGDPANLRGQHPNAALAKLTLEDVVAQCEQAARALTEKPIIIGHSMGGLVAQILLNRGVAAGGAAIDPAPPRGVFTLSWSFLKSNFPIINPLESVDQPMFMTLEQFQYAFANAMPLAEQKAAYERYCIPESRRVGRGSFSAIADLDYAKTRVPLLITAGADDHIIPPSLNRANFEKYRGAPNVALKEFAGRCHFLIGQAGWQEVADAVLKFLKDNQL